MISSCAYNLDNAKCVCVLCYSSRHLKNVQDFFRFDQRIKTSLDLIKEYSDNLTSG